MLAKRSGDGGDAVVLAEDLVDVRVRLQARRARAREQARDEVGAIGRELEERLVEEEEREVLAADVDDEGNPRPDPGDVAEVLLRADADVGAAAGAQPPDGVGEVRLVRDEVFREGERAGRLRERFDQGPEVAIAQRVRKRGALAGAAGERDEAEHDGKRERATRRARDILTSAGPARAAGSSCLLGWVAGRRRASDRVAFGCSRQLG